MLASSVTAGGLDFETSRRARIRAGFKRLRRLARRLPPKFRAHVRLRLALAEGDLCGPPTDIWAKTLFIHVPKAAGSSVQAAGLVTTPGHRSWRYYRHWCPPDNPMPETMAIVRDPYDRFLSAYRYLKQGGGNPLDAAWARRRLKGTRGPNDFAISHLNRPAVLKWMHFRPQTDLVCDGQGRIAVTHLLRFEHLTRDWSAFAKLHGLTNPLPVENRTSVPATACPLSPAARAAIERAYAVDFETLGYPTRT